MELCKCGISQLRDCFSTFQPFNLSTLPPPLPKLYILHFTLPPLSHFSPTVRIVFRRLVCSREFWYNTSVSCRKTGNRSNKGIRSAGLLHKNVSAAERFRGDFSPRVIRSRRILGGAPCVIPLGIPVALTGHARGAAIFRTWASPRPISKCEPGK